MARKLVYMNDGRVKKMNAQMARAIEALKKGFIIGDDDLSKAPLGYPKQELKHITPQSYEKKVIESPVLTKSITTIDETGVKEENKPKRGRPKKEKNDI